MWHARPATQWHAQCALMQCVASLRKTFNEIGVNKLTTETWRHVARMRFDSLLYLALLQNVRLPLKVGLKSGALAILGCIKITAGGTPISNILGCLHAVVF